MDQKFSVSTAAGRPRVKFGVRPAVIVIDFQLAITDPRFAGGNSPAIHRAVEQTASILSRVREVGLPVASCRTGWESAEEIKHCKLPVADSPHWFVGSRGQEMDPRIYREDYDFNFCKKAPSIFFGTPLVSFLIRNAIDTVLITGCNTSGCIRAAVTDSFSYGYRTILIEDCCADVDEAAHQSDVRACGRRYCDIATSEDVLTHFEQMGEP